MTYFERLYMALWITETWTTAIHYIPERKAYYRAIAVVIFDRLIQENSTGDINDICRPR